ncbi:hypothetical protein NQ317_009900 [Molorchus minor]|uniref:Uncharacterized protein n=1 Tax=Molorchus minor TaxID=1323400 RepID=A0ABQ9IUJ1_9CUCU|nr:hypothetical protein NQ317_009900 [Molorchus minor]
MSGRLSYEEALRGKFLAAQINAVSEQTEQFVHVNDDMIKTSEEANMKILRNIKRLSGAVKQYETRIKSLREIAESTQKVSAKTSQQTFFF